MDNELKTLDQLREEVQNCRAKGEYYRNILESADKGTWVVNDDGKTVFINYRMAEMLGHNTEEIIGTNIFEFIDYDHRCLFTSKLNGCPTDNCESFDIKLLHKNGNDLWALVGFRPLFDKSGKYIGINGTFVDITERKLAEDIRNKLLHTLGERVKELTMLYGVSNIVQAPGNTREILQGIALMLPPAWQYPEITVSRITYDDMSLTSPDFRETPWSQRAGFTTAAGKNGTVEVYYTEEKSPEAEGPFLLEERRLIDTLAEIIKTYLDSAQAKEALRESEEKFRILAETAPVAIFFHNGDTFIYANPAALKMADDSYDNISKMKFWDLFVGESRDLVKERGLARLNGEDPPPRYEVKFRTLEGEKWMDITSSRVKYKGMTAILTVGMDVTDSKNAEIALREAKANSEFFIDLISHDIGNMNQAVLGYLELAQDLLPVGDEHKELIAKPMEIIHKSSRLIKDVRKLRQIWNGGMETKMINAGELLSRAAAGFKANGNTTINCPPIADCYVTACEELGDAFSSIIANMDESEKPRKTIDISVDRIKENGSPYYKFIFQDDGPGINDESKKRIMSNAWGDNGKTVRKGLGPKLVQSMAEALHGRFWIEDRVPDDYTKGARFIVMLPAVEK